MFDAHRHFRSESKMSLNALFATSRQNQWSHLDDLQGQAVAGVGALADDTLPSAEVLETFLRLHPSFQIAEVGLDKRFPSIEDQTQFLEDVLQIAYQLDRSVSLHCVRSDGYLLSLLQKRKQRLPRILWHGFTASFEIATQAARLGIILSYGPRLHTSKLAKEGRRLVEIPYALETDFDDEDESGYEQLLSEHLYKFSSLCSLSEDQIIRNNDDIRTILTNQQTVGK